MSYQVFSKEVVQEPADFVIEKNLVGMFCVDKAHMHICLSAGLRPQHFKWRLPQEIFKAQLALDDQVSQFDWFMVGQKVTSTLKQEKTTEVVDLLGSAGRLKVEALTIHAKTVMDRASKGQLISAINEMMEKAQEPGFTVADHLPGFMEKLEFMLSNSNGPSAGLQCIADVLRKQTEAMERREAGEDNRITTGIEKLDELIGVGMFPGQLVVVAGRPAMGKSVFAQHLATVCVKRGGTAFIFSLEMPIVQVADRLIASTGSVSLKDIRNPRNADDHFFERYTLAVQMAEADLQGLMIDETPRRTVQAIVREAKRQAMKTKPDLIVIDYLTLIESENEKGEENEALRIGKITRYLKNVALEMNTTIVLLSQFNRSAELFMDKRPTAAQLKSSGSIEQDADTVIGIHRPFVYDQNFDDPELCELLVLKAREGHQGTAYCSFRGAWQSFSDRPGYEPPAIENAHKKYQKGIKA